MEVPKVSPYSSKKMSCYRDTGSHLGGVPPPAWFAFWSKANKTFSDSNIIDFLPLVKNSDSINPVTRIIVK